MRVTLVPGHIGLLASGDYAATPRSLGPQLDAINNRSLSEEVLNHSARARSS